MVYGLIKECPSYHNILQSKCSKLECQKDGKPAMIPGGGVSKAVRLKLSQVFQDVSSEDEDEGGESAEDSTDDDICGDVELKEAINKIKTTWKYLSPLNKECDLVGKWFAVIYDGGSESNETISYRRGWTRR